MVKKKVPLNQINNGYAVFLIFVSLLGAFFFEPLLMGIFGTDTFFPILVFYLAMNLTAIYHDEKQAYKSIYLSSESWPGIYFYLPHLPAMGEDL